MTLTTHLIICQRVSQTLKKNITSTSCAILYIQIHISMSLLTGTFRC